MFNPSTSSPLPQLKPIQPKRRRKAKSALSGADARAASGAVCALPDYDCLRRYEEHLRLRGKAGRTREEYLRYARKLAQLGRCDPATLTEARIRAFFLYLKEHLKYAPSSLRLAVAALRFFYNDFLERNWKLFELIRVPQPRTLPCVLSRTETAQLLNTVREPRYRMLFELIYGCGLRVGEAVRIEVGDLRAESHRLLIRQGKGGRDRAVPLPDALLESLRAFWKTHGGVRKSVCEDGCCLVNY